VSLAAVVLVGGEGTRLRPLTQRTPKPMLPLVDRPLIEYTFEHLRRHGVRRIVLSCGYLPTQIQQHFGSQATGVEIEYKVEESPLGTGGAIAFGADGLEETFLAVNGDSLRGADLGALIDFHRERGAKATILLTPVADPSRYGLVRLGGDGRVTGFLEKPRPDEIDTDLINAGVYVLEPEVLELVPRGQMVSIERDVFPRLVEQGSCYGLALPGYWLDVGTPASYLQAHRDVLERNVPSDVGDALGRDYTTVHPTAQVSPEARLIPPVAVGRDAVIEAGVRVGSLAVVGAGARVGEGSVVEHAVVQAGVELGSGCVVLGSILGEGAKLGAGCKVSGLSVVGPGALVGEANTLDAGLRVAADAEIPARSLSFA
jgi:mannose-1-phosphate guanylyltransferase